MRYMECTLAWKLSYIMSVDHLMHTYANEVHGLEQNGRSNIVQHATIWATISKCRTVISVVIAIGDASFRVVRSR